MENSGRRWFSIINGIGLSIGLALGILVLLYVKFEMTYDCHFQHIDNMYRIVSKGEVEKNPIHTATVPVPLGKVTSQLDQFLLHSTQFVVGSDKLVRYHHKAFAENRLFYADSGFFSVFDVVFISGTAKDVFSDSSSVVVTQSTAARYFGHENPMGKVIEIDNGVKLTITGVCEDLPENSHLQFDFVTSFSVFEQLYRNQDGDDAVNGWLNNWFNLSIYQYVILKKNAPVETFVSEINRLKQPELIKQMESLSSLKDMMSTKSHLDFELQPVRKIHLSPKLEGELSEPANSFHVKLVLVLALVILLMTTINFVNLTTSHVLIRKHEVNVRMQMGARRTQLFFMFLGESFINTFFALFVALVLVEICFPLFNNWLYLGIKLSMVREWSDVLLEFSLMVGVALLTGLIPAFYFSRKKIRYSSIDADITNGGSYWLRGVLVLVQVAATVVFLILLIGMWVQIKGIHKTNLGYNPENVLVIKRGYAVGENFEEFKAHLLKNSSIISVSGCSSLPGEDKTILTFRLDDGKKRPFYLSNVNWIEDDFYKTLEIPIVEGRSATANDSGFIVVNQKLMKDLNLQRIDSHYITMVGDGEHGADIPLTVTGVMKDFNFESLKQPIPSVINLPEEKWFRFILVRHKPGMERQAMTAVVSEWNQYSKLEPFNTFRLRDKVNSLYRQDYRLFRIVSVLCFFSFFMSTLSLIGLVVFYVNTNSKELRIRQIQGAAPYQQYLGVVHQLSFFVISGVLIGVPLSFVALRLWIITFVVTYPLAGWAFLPLGMIVGMLALAIIYQQARRLIAQSIQR
jgi:putative ABC transport system permease protein